MTRRKTERVKRGSTTWTSIELPRKADVIDIAKDLKLEADHVEALRVPTYRTRLFESKKYLLLVVTHPVFDVHHRDIIEKELDIIITPTKIITIQREPFARVSELFQEVKATRSHSEMVHPARLLTTILHGLMSDVYATLDNMALTLDSLEKRVFQEKENILPQILRSRTNLIDIQKAVAAQEIVLERLFDAAPASARRHLEKPVKDLLQHSREIFVNLEMEQKTADTLHNTHEVVLSKRTNRLINMLTKLSLFLLPSTLLAGVFGMNTKHSWIIGLKHDFAIIVLIMLVSVLTLYLLTTIRPKE